MRIPVTILTGFLGAGKTTTLNQIIIDNPGKKLVIIENEFGEINIDHELVINVDEGVYEMSNGCVCCTMSGELEDILNRIVEEQTGTDHLIIETTGLADPGPVALRFLSDYDTQINYRLDGVVCLVDAKFLRSQLDETVEAGKQLAVADLILINKSDLMEELEILALVELVGNINPYAIVMVGSYGQINDKQNLLFINAYDARNTVYAIEKTFPKTQTSTIRPSTAVKTNVNSHRSVFAPAQAHEHTAEIGSCAIVIKEKLDLLLFDRWMGMFLMANARNVYRVKGFLNIELMEKRLIFQSVHDQFACEEGDVWEEDAACTKLVFIGKNLDAEQIERGLRQCIFDESKIKFNY